MSIKFCFVSITWPSYSSASSCGRERPSSEDCVFERDLDSLKPKYVDYSEKQLVALQEKYSRPLEDKPSFWTKAAIYILARLKFVQCIDFIPKNPSGSNLVHIKKVKDEECSSEKLYEHHRGSSRFYLPCETFPEENVFPLKGDEIRVSNVEKPLDYIAKALYCVAKDKTKAGIALTIEGQTFIWMKC